MAGQQLAATFVEPRGAIRSVIVGTIGREVAGAVGSVTASPGSPGKDAGSSPLAAGAIGYLAVFDDQLVLYRGKRGAFKPKPTEEVVAVAPRAAITGAILDRKKIAGVLTVTFADTDAWTFDIPKIHLGGAETIARTLTA
jgi:hypothetical protein